MKGNQRLIETLNGLLADELTAVDQYMVHSGMCENWGYGKLHDHFEKRVIDEMKHAEKLKGILNDEDRHIDKIEELQDQIEQMSLSMFLSMQT